jgi:hypothetical protein
LGHGVKRTWKTNRKKLFFFCEKRINKLVFVRFSLPYL